MRIVRAWLALWFGFGDPVGRGTYFRHGLGLFLLKYGVDVLLAWLVLHRVWTPLDYLLPTLSRQVSLGVVPAALLVTQLLWTLPFLWIGVSMTMRRAVDAGLSPWLCLLFLCPFLNYAVMAALSLAPGRPHAAWTMAVVEHGPGGRLKGALVGLFASLLASGALVVVSTLAFGAYGASVFVLAPFLLGSITAWAYNREHARSLGETCGVVLLALLIAAGGLVLFAMEGVLCVAMAVPLALPIACVGAVVGRAIAQHRGATPAHAALVLLLAPGTPILDAPRTASPVREVCTSTVVDAPPERVWRDVVSFAEVTEPPRWFFRLGIAYPRRAAIEGSGIGAIRRCEFSTGAFVEPITAWDAPTRLAFDVTEQPPPLAEWSPYAGLSPPHLARAFRSRRGEFRLVTLPGGRTRLEGRTWYVLEMQPRAYWSLWSDAIVHAIHSRVLAHVKTLAERGESDR